MKCLSTHFVALARSAHRESMLYHSLGDHDMEEFCGQLVRDYMDRARHAKANNPRWM